MIRITAVLFVLTLAGPSGAQGQTAVSRLKKSSATTEPKSPWSGSIRYTALTDLADDRKPKSYNHAVFGSLNYAYSPQWSTDLNVGGRAETVGGKIPKGLEQTYDETLGPSTSVSLNYAQKFFRRHSYRFYFEGEPLWDEASRREGYRGLLGGGTGITFSLLSRRFIVSNDLNLTRLFNTYRYGSDLNANPDYFVTYRLSTVLRIYGGWRASYSFGAKVTRYLDSYVGYSYSNSVALSHVWPSWSLALSYDNGGFTDEGDISLWYIDNYRRLTRLLVGYTF